jgi:hypothetical protein
MGRNKFIMDTRGVLCEVRTKFYVLFRSAADLVYDGSQNIVPGVKQQIHQHPG